MARARTARVGARSGTLRQFGRAGRRVVGAARRTVANVGRSIANTGRAAARAVGRGARAVGRGALRLAASAARGLRAIFGFGRGTGARNRLALGGAGG
jgi:hypothetical protein